MGFNSAFKGLNYLFCLFSVPIGYQLSEYFFLWGVWLRTTACIC